MTGEFWHVEPVSDSKEHSTGYSSFCKCQPRVETQANGNVIVVHNAWDGREFYEGDMPSIRELRMWGQK